jgi:sigma-B regulation protein RsbU (phosphoserine phosphatase)
MALIWEPPQAIALDPFAEGQRLESLHSLHLLENVAEDRFDRITQLAAEFFRVPTAYIAFIDSERQWFKSSFGICPTETRRHFSLCQYTIQRGEPLVINDAREHQLSCSHPMVTGEPYLRFYAGVPLNGPKGQKIGTFCIVDFQPREFGSEHVAQLSSFAAIVQREINLSDIIQSQNELLNTRQQLVETQERLRREFDDAAKYVRLMLPPPLAGRETLDWLFQPSTHLGGDGLGYRRINDDQIAFYVLDVTGHGLGSALLAVTALELLRARTVRDIDFARPASVVERLNRTFQMKDHAGKFFSAWYGVYSHAERKITYANSGHPPPLLLTRGEKDVPLLAKTPPGGPVLGVLPEILVTETTIDFPAGSELYLFTDGLYETRGHGKEHGSYDEFLQYLAARLEDRSPYESILQWLDAAHKNKVIDDDVTLLRFAVNR